jgi:putative hydrolase of the HAD superfamily
MTDLCVVFDLDDTLYPEASYARGGLRAAGLWAEQELGIPDLGPKLIALFDSGRRGDLFDAALAQSGAPVGGSVVGRLIDAYRTHKPDLALFEDAAWALVHYGRLGPLGLVTDGHAAVQQAKVAGLGIGPRFRHMVFTDALGGRPFWKPSPAGFEAVAQSISEASAFVYIGDNATKDFVAPNALGWQTVRIVRPLGEYRSTVAPPGGAPQHTISALTELPGVLGR